MAAALAVTLAGCGESGSSAQSDTGSGSTSWRFELTTTTAHEDPDELRFTGAYDRDRQVGRVLVDAPHERGWFFTSCEYESGRHYPEEERVVAGRGYSRWLTWGTSYWVGEELAPATVPFGDVLELVAPFPIGVLRPTDILSRMRRYSDVVETVGTEWVRAHETTHYRARLDIERFFARSREWERPPEWVLTRAEQRRAPIDVDAWIDSDQRVRRMTVHLSVEGLGSLGNVTTYSLDLFDYGVRVKVPAPLNVVTRDDYYEAAEKGWPDDESDCVRWRPEEEGS